MLPTFGILYFCAQNLSYLNYSRGILHDPAVYPDPMAFKPERYFSSDGVLEFSSNDPEKYAFGYGRRYA